MQFPGSSSFTKQISNSFTHKNIPESIWDGKKCDEDSNARGIAEDFYTVFEDGISLCSADR